MAKNQSLNAAAKAKEDEFYTQLADVESELRHYRQHFNCKTVFCNCDDPFESNFFKYFVLNFNRLGLKKLIATCYTGSPIAGSQLTLFDVLDDAEVERPYKAVVTQVYDATGDGGVDMDDVAELFKQGANELTRLDGDGDFRSPECLALMDEADIVVTNPPFSLFREYVATLMEHGKDFIIIGSQNAITYKEIFPLLMHNRMWIGYNSGDMAFRVPAHYEPRETRFWVDDDGQKWRSMGNICWYTNLDLKKRHEEMILVQRYSPDKYPRYANYDAIEVGKLADIPCDYAGLMGVPITFLDKYNPDQFEIIGQSRTLGRPMSEIAEKGEYVSGGVRFYIEEDASEQASKRASEQASKRASEQASKRASEQARLPLPLPLRPDRHQKSTSRGTGGCTTGSSSATVTRRNRGRHANRAAKSHGRGGGRRLLQRR